MCHMYTHVSKQLRRGYIWVSNKCGAKDWKYHYYINDNNTSLKRIIGLLTSKVQLTVFLILGLLTTKVELTVFLILGLLTNKVQLTVFLILGLLTNKVQLTVFLILWLLTNKVELTVFLILGLLTKSSVNCISDHRIID